jgi:hypothetical protein
VQVAEALSMLEGAVDLAEGHYGVGHPSCLNPLLDLIDALRQVCVYVCVCDFEPRNV